VVGKFGRPERVEPSREFGQASRERLVVADALARQELAVDGLLKQGVAEHILVAGRSLVHADQDPLVDDLADGRHRVREYAGRDHREESDVDPVTGGRRDPEKLPCGLAEAFDPCEQDVLDCVRQSRRVSHGDKLLGQIGVALGTRLDPGQQGRLGILGWP
jgi:hypothetical protein